MKKYSVCFTAWEVTQPDYGGIKNEHLAYFSTESEASKYKTIKEKQIKWPCNIHRIVVDKSWIVCDTVEDLEQLSLEKRKEAALAKLTEEERKLLGV